MKNIPLAFPAIAGLYPNQSKYDNNPAKTFLSLIYQHKRPYSHLHYYPNFYWEENQARKVPSRGGVTPLFGQGERAKRVAWSLFVPSFNRL